MAHDPTPRHSLDCKENRVDLILAQNRRDRKTFEAGVDMTHMMEEEWFHLVHDKEKARMFPGEVDRPRKGAPQTSDVPKVMLHSRRVAACRFFPRLG